MDVVIAFILGLSVGSGLGMILAALLSANGKGDDE